MSPHLIESATLLTRCALFAAMHSVLAMPRIKLLLAPQGHKEPRWYRLAYNLISLALFAWVMASWRSSPVLYYIPGIWSLVIQLGRLGIVLALAFCIRQTGAGEFLGTDQVRHLHTNSPKLQTGGWYGIVRHPLYFLTIAFMITTPVMTMQWLILTIFSACYCIVGALIEEKRLGKKFGADYHRYRERVPFILPFSGTRSST